MSLGLVRFTLVGPGRTGSIEISQAGIAKTVNLMEPGQHALDQQLRFTVGVGGLEAVVLLNRSALRIPEQCGRRGKYKTLHSRGQHCFQQGQRICGVVAEEFLRGLHRLARFDQSRKVDDGINRARPE